MTVLALENCPLLTTYSQVLKITTLEMQSNVVFSNKNTRLRVVSEFFFARFLKNHLNTTNKNIKNLLVLSFNSPNSIEGKGKCYKTQNN